MLKKLLSFLFGKTEVKTTEMVSPVPVISIHEDIKKTLDEMKEQRESIIPEKPATKLKKVETTKSAKTTKTPKTTGTKKTASKKKVEAPVSAKEKSKRGPKKSK